MRPTAIPIDHLHGIPAPAMILPGTPASNTGWPAALNQNLVGCLSLLAGSVEVPAEALQIIGHDPGLSARILELHCRLVDRRGLGMPTLEDCLHDLGAQAVKVALLDCCRLNLTGGSGTQPDTQGLRQARVAARMAAALATAMDYARPHEAALSGMLYIPTQLSELSSVAQLADRVDAWGYNSFLGDALRYQHLGVDSLEDAATLVRIAAAVHALLYGLESRCLDDAARLTGLPVDLLLRERDQAWAAVPELAATDSGTTELILHLSRFAMIEGQAHASRPRPTQALSELAGQLHAGFGLHHVLLLELAADANTLAVRCLDGSAAPDLAMRAQGGHLSARALAEGTALVLSDASQASSVLDRQLLRWAKAEVMLALPSKTGPTRRILLAFASQAPRLGEDLPYLSKLVELATGTPAPLARPGGPASGRADDWSAVARQVVHEINNPLGIIKNYMGLLRVKLGENPAIADELRIIHEELDRVARIARQLVQAPASTEAVDEETDLNALLEDLIRVAGPGMMAHKQVHMEARLAPDLPNLRIDRDRTKQLLLNLLLNAIEAAPHASTVIVETHRVIGMRRDDHLEVLISNAGAPIRPEVLARLFDPLDSSKGQGHAGLGLSIVKTLASELRADVNCRSYNGMTTFQVMLPLA